MEIDRKSWRSPNFEARAGGVSPSMIIVHYTGMQSAEAALSRLCDPLAKVSAHYCIDEGGTIYALVDEGMRAWHAGKSYWDGVEDINSHSIGIELVNPGHEFGYRPFPAVQIEAFIALCHDIKSRHEIEWILGHSDVAPERKQDPGELFPWNRVADENIGKLAKDLKP